MKALRRILFLAWKDINDAIRDARVLVALIVPIGIGLFYSFAFDDSGTTTVHVNLAITSPDRTELVNQIEAVLPDNVRIAIHPYQDQAAVEHAIASDEDDIGIVVPAGFDAALAAGQQPTLTVVSAPQPSLGATYIATAIDPAVRALAGQDFPAQIAVVIPPDAPSSNITDTVGLRTWSILLAIVMSCCLVAILAIPIVLVEEVEKKTIDALILAMRYWEIVAAKTLLGLSYTTIMTVLLVAITRLDVLRWGLFALAVLLTSIALLGLGLLLAGLFRSANQLNTWSGLTLTPILAPALIIGPPVPDLVLTIARLFPTGAGMALMVDSVSDPAVFDETPRLVLTLIIWALVAFALLIVRLRRSQA